MFYSIQFCTTADL